MVNHKSTLKNTNKTSGDSDIPRRRGRPAGKNRVPLTQEERRARNAQYERERRIETAEAMSQLLDAAHCDPDISNADLLATVISRIQKASRVSDDITDLKRINANLEAQIATLQDRLGLGDEDLELLDADDINTETAKPHSSSRSRPGSKNCKSENSKLKKQSKKRKRSDRLSSENKPPEKRSKTRSETSSVDSGIEMRGQTVSPPTMCVPDITDITEERFNEQGEYQTLIELQSELYKQTYNSDYQSPVQTISLNSMSMTQFIASLSADSPSIPVIEILTRSLMEVPSIVPPPQEPPGYLGDPQSELADPVTVELPCDLKLTNERDFLQQNGHQEFVSYFLTDSEKRSLSELIGADFFQTSFA